MVCMRASRHVMGAPDEHGCCGQRRAERISLAVSLPCFPLAGASGSGRSARTSLTSQPQHAECQEHFLRSP